MHYIPVYHQDASKYTEMPHLNPGCDALNVPNSDPFVNIIFITNLEEIVAVFTFWTKMYHRLMS